MRRSYNPNVPDTRATSCLEVTRRLYKSITDVAKRLDDQKGCALTITDLFTPSGQLLRAKLKDYCERLIFKDLAGHARKIEELLWRRGFYDTVFTAKKLRKGNVWNETEKALLSTHLSSGVGFYHHLILRLQLEYSLDLFGVTDFAYPKEKSNPADSNPKMCQKKLPSDQVRQCAIRMIHRSLVCLGDLARYNIDLDPNWDSNVAARYYKIAVTIDPTIGMPHNQLGTMAGNKNHGLDAAYHYMRCIMCAEPFEGAEGNLKRIVAARSNASNEATAFEKCIAKLFALLQLWESDSPDVQRINHHCQDFLVELEGCLVVEKFRTNVKINIEDEDKIQVYLEKCRNESTPCLADDTMFKIVAVCLMAIANLNTKQSGQVQGAVAFTLTILSQLMQTTINRLREAVTKASLPNGLREQLELDREYSKNDEKKLTNSVVEPVNVETHCDDRVDVNDNEQKPLRSPKNATNGISIHGVNKKLRDKSKNLLTKLRRPRKRLNSSDSEASDADGTRAETSSDELNSDISETEEEEEEEDEEDDVVSESNVISDDVFSEDLSEDEIAKNICREKNGRVIDKNDDEKNKIVTHRKTEINDSSAIEDESRSMEIGSSMNGKNVDNNSIKIDDDENSLNDSSYVIQLKKQKLRSIDVVRILEAEGSLQTIKICFDWLHGNPDIFRMFAKSSNASLKRVVTLLNLVKIDTKSLMKDWDRDSTLSSSHDRLNVSKDVVPLPEDVDMRGLKIFHEAHDKIDWGSLRQTKMTKHEETLLRALKLTNFGNYVCSIDDSGVKFDKNMDLFVTIGIKNCETIGNDGGRMEGGDVETERSRGKLMRHMGRLWLKAEVRALESRLRSRLISPYLVPDQEALAKHIPALKRLVYAKKFVVIIPSVVVSALDEMKKTSSKAREATRWLEGQLRKGSRFLRAQRPHERLPLPLIKGPKTKDKEAWLFFQIIECCHYLTQQTKVGLNGDKEPPVVTLLTGFSAEERKATSFSADGLTKTAGVNLEHIETFHTKWKTSSKSHG